MCGLRGGGGPHRAPPPPWKITSYYPHAFFKKAKGILLSPPSVRPSFRQSVRPSVMLFPAKQLDEIQPNWVCELLTGIGSATSNFFCPAPLGPWGGVKRSNVI